MLFARKVALLIAGFAAAVCIDSLQAQDAPKKPESPKEFKALKYRNIGPAAGGRVARVTGVPGNPMLFYAAAASGGVWMSGDGGTTWKAIFDDQPISSIGSIAVAPSDPNVIYVGSGEANIRGNVAAGNGIYKSTDAGKTWTHVWNQEGQIGTMVVHPKNPDIAFAAVLGHAFGPNPERGVYRTRDGGKTWQQVLKKNSDTGASDVTIDATNPNILFAGLWQARRFPWDLQSGGPGSGLYSSRDGGDTWKPITGHGLPDGILGKIGVAIAPSDGQRVYALIEAEKGGLFRSDNGGEDWELVSANRALRQRAWYYSTLAVNPSNPNEVWFPQVPMLKTIDGGKTIEYVKGIQHGDNHDIWFDPIDPRRRIVGNDGGVNVTRNGGQSWYAAPLPISQFYHVSVDMRRPYDVAGAMQDLGTAQGPSNSLNGGGIHLTDWHDVGGGEAGHVYSDPSDPNIVYAGEYLGILTRYDHRTGESRNVSAWPENPSGKGGEEMKYRFQWTAPIAGSPHDPKVVYHGAQVIFRTRDGGQHWDVISPDLTRNDKTKQKWSGGPITGDNTGVETFCTVFAIAESPKQKGLIWAGTDDGLVQVTTDDGKNWKNVTAAMPDFPEWGTVSMIEPSPFDANTAYVVVDAHRLDNMHPYLYATSDLGLTWKRIDGDLPQDVYLHAVREDPKKRGQLYLGTERGVMYSPDHWKDWRPLKLNMPTVAVHDLQVKDDNLVVATHGRSLWILDDLQPVREYTPEIALEPVHLFAPADAVRWRYGSSNWGTRGSFPNPPKGAAIYYSLKDEEKGELKIEILDSTNKVIRTLSSTAPEPMGSDDNEDPEDFKNQALPRGAGVQRAVWDLRHEGARKIKGAKIDTGDPITGPFVIPGAYTVRLTVAGKTLTAPLKVVPDPRGDLSASDLMTQTTFALRIRDDISKLTDLVNQVRAVRDQLKAHKAALEPRKTQEGIDALLRASDAAIKRTDELENKLHNPTAEVVYDILAMRGGTRLYSRLSPLQGWASDGNGVPTGGMMQVLVDQEKELTALETETKQFMDADVASINQRASRLGVPFVVVKQ